MQIYSERSRYSPQWINSCSVLQRKEPGQACGCARQFPKPAPNFVPKMCQKANHFFFFSKSVLFSPDSVPVLGQERFPLTLWLMSPMYFIWGGLG